MPPKNKPSYLTVAFFTGWTVYFAVVWSKMFWVNDKGALFARHVNVWGDWAVHFTMGSAMAFRELFLTQSPLVLGAPFRYPYFANFLSAVLIRMGVPFLSAFTIPSFFFSIFLIGSLFLFYKRWFQSSTIAMLGSFIFLFNGGLGFLSLLQDIFTSETPWKLLFFPRHLATNFVDWNIHWISVIDSMIIPQRSFQIGFPVALLILTLVLRRKNILLAGVLWGILPLLHTHSFVCVSLILACWCAGDFATTHPLFWKKKLSLWTLLTVPAVLCAVPLLNHLDLLSGKEGSLVWNLGWYSDGIVDWIGFWIVNWGFAPILGTAGAIRWISAVPSKAEKIERLFMVVPFVLLFVVLNVLQLQFWIWDNTKILVWVSLGVSGLAGYWISKQKKILGGALFFLLTVSGGIDAYRLLLNSINTFQMYSQEELQLAQWTRDNTVPNSIWLTAPYHNNWLFNLTGRRAILTYEGWAWTHGYDYQKNKERVEELFEHPEAQELYARTKVDYIVMGPVEKKISYVDPKKFETYFTPVKQTENFVIYSTKKADAGTNSSLPPGNSQ